MKTLASLMLAGALVFAFGQSSFAQMTRRLHDGARRSESPGYVRRRCGQESQVQGMFGQGRRARLAWQGAQRVPRKVQEKLSRARL